MDEESLQAHRRSRLIAWIDAKGGASKLVELRGLPRSVLSHISQIKGGFVFGQRAARNMEKKLGMPIGYLDFDAANPSGSTAEFSTYARELAGYFDDMVRPVKVEQVRAFNAATEAIAAVARQHAAEQSALPAKSPSPETRHE